MICVALPTVRVPTILVLPLSASTPNFSTADPFLMEKTSLAASTIRESLIVVSPWTTSVPSVATLPDADATVNLSVVPFLTAKLASTSTVPLNSEFAATVRESLVESPIVV